MFGIEHLGVDLCLDFQVKQVNLSIFNFLLRMHTLTVVFMMLMYCGPAV